MKRQWTNEELIVDFTISAKELDLIGDSKADHNLLGAACLLKYFQLEGRFPAQKQDLPTIVIVHLAQQLGVAPEKIIPYDWEGRTIKAHRALIRSFLGVHEATLADEEALVEWLASEVLAEQRQEEALIASFYTRCKEQLIDPPTPDRVRRLVHTAIHRFDERLCASIMQQLSLETRTQLDALLTVGVPEAREETLSADLGTPLEEGAEEASPETALPRPQSTLHALKQDVGPLSLERVLQEIAKLERIHQLGLPADLFDHVSAKTVDSYRNRIAVEDLQEVLRHPDPIRYTLLAAYCCASSRRLSIPWSNCCWMWPIISRLRPSGVWKKPSSRISKRSLGKRIQGWRLHLSAAGAEGNARPLQQTLPAHGAGHLETPGLLLQQ
jgi:hypothetical protein